MGCPISLSQSGIQTWLACQRKWKYTYVDRVESVASPTPEQRFGTGFHKLLEYWWTGQQTGLLEWREVGLEGKEKSHATTLLAAYSSLYTVPSGIVGAEIPFQLERIHGVFDAVYRTADGGVVVVEHKTTKTDFSVDEFYWERVRYDWQVGLYQLAAREVYNTDNVTVLYDVIRVPQLRQKKGESAIDYR